MHTNSSSINNYMKECKNTTNACKPYRAINMIIQKTEIPNESEKPKEDIINKKPIENIVTDKNLIPKDDEFGYILVRVYTALGALPVPNAVVTIYNTISDTGEEHAIGNLITDANGIAKKIQLPVLSDSVEPNKNSKYYFSTYNMRIQAPGYYPVNILQIPIFPGISTNYKIDLIPIMAGEQEMIPEQTIIIPPPPIESTIKRGD